MSHPLGLSKEGECCPCVCSKEMAPVSVEAVIPMLCYALLVGSGTRGCLCCFCLPWGQAQTCVSSWKSAWGVEKPPQNMHLQALMCRSPSQAVTTSCYCVSGKTHCLFPGMRRGWCLPCSGIGSQGWLQALELEPEPSLSPSTSSRLQL